MRRELLRPLLVVLAVSFLLTGCYVGAHGPHGGMVVNSPPPYGAPAPPPVVSPGPPPHAKAYGHRAKYNYYYYPDAYVYFDLGRNVYFYLQNGGWTMSASLPSGLRISLGEKVSLEMEVDRPYLEHDAHRKKYPGKKEKGKKQKGKKGNKHDRDDRDD